MNIKQLFRILSINRRKTIEAISGTTMGRVVAVHSSTGTVDVQPVINKTVKGQSRPHPVLQEVPVGIQSGGSSYEAYPIAIGDECLLWTCERCFDNWYYGQDMVSPPEDRMFDKSDCIAWVGVKSLANIIQIPSVIERHGDCDIEGDYFHTGDYHLVGDETHEGDRTHAGNTVQTGNNTINGGLAVNNATGPPSTGSGTLNWTGDIVLNGKSLDGHIHSGVQAGGDNSGGMV